MRCWNQGVIWDTVCLGRSTAHKRFFAPIMPNFCLVNFIVCQQSGDLFRDLVLQGIGMLLVVNTVLI